ncbi:MAG: M23 family metallopeptidase [Firmicutes bacterium]|nr:M23 family metallopeptidase [Bacillota bacterium]
MKKALIIVLCVFLLFIPTFVAIVSYVSAQNNPVDQNAVTKIDITDPQGKLYSFDKESAKNVSGVEGGIIAFLTELNSSAKTATELPSPLVGTPYFKVSYYSYDKTTDYKYYFSTDPSSAYYTDNNNKAYRITPEYAEKFLNLDLALCLYPSAESPVLKVGGNDVVQPQNMSWKYLSYNGDYKGVTVPSSDAVNTYDIRSTLNLDFDVSPDYLLVNITNTKDGSTVFDDLYENIDTSIFADNAVYSVTLSAKWYESSGRGNCGEGVYKFIANVLAPAVFYIGETTVDPGEFVVISGKNVVDPAAVTVTTEPEIGVSPVFFSSGDFVHALVPINMELPYSETYKLTVTCDGVSQEFTVNVNNKKFNAQTHTFSAATVTTYRSAKALAEFDATLSQYFTAQYNDLYWLDGGLFLEPVAKRSIRTGFGLNITLSATSTKYRHEGVNYVVSAGDKAISAMGGKIIYTGDLTLSGKTVIVDHGGGLKSLYAHLSSISVSVGDVVEKGQELGVVGATGFTEGTSLHYGLYIFGTPVCPYYLWENGVAVNPSAKQ